jgi:prepilin-type N-terminal cleavage/methylation domain-containing protein/prepilin-type processing-associated H-X9-DG protein
MCDRKGFTLIELLVVIAIIALLMTILMPSLRLAKIKATGAVCASRQHSAILSYTLYADDNDSDLVNSDTMASGTNGFTYWVEPLTEWKIKGRQEGIMNGALYPYIKDIDFYHCPADRRFKNPPETGACAFRTYSITAGLHSAFADPKVGFTGAGRADYIPYTKIGQIRTPSKAFCFVEETEMEAGYNRQSWAMNVTEPFMWDPLAVLHGNSSTLGFVDGHAEIHKWRTDIVIEMFRKGEKWLDTGDGLTMKNEDYEFLCSIFPYERTIRIR